MALLYYISSLGNLPGLRLLPRGMKTQQHCDRNNDRPGFPALSTFSHWSHVRIEVNGRYSYGRHIRFDPNLPDTFTSIRIYRAKTVIHSIRFESAGVTLDSNAKVWCSIR